MGHACSSWRAGLPGEPLRWDNAHFDASDARKRVRRGSPPVDTPQAQPREDHERRSNYHSSRRRAGRDRHDTGSDGREGDSIREEIEPELAPIVDRSERACFSDIDTLEARWRAWRSEPLPWLDGDALLARTEQRLHAICQRGCRAQRLDAG